MAPGSTHAYRQPGAHDYKAEPGEVDLEDLAKRGLLSNPPTAAIVVPGGETERAPWATCTPTAATATTRIVRTRTSRRAWTRPATSTTS